MKSNIKAITFLLMNSWQKKATKNLAASLKSVIVKGFRISF